MNYDEQKNELWDYIESHEIATKDELMLVVAINGDSLETLESVLYARTGSKMVWLEEEAV